jgi:hypothetical protein
MNQEASVERRRTGGMTAIAILNIILGGFVILNGLNHFIVSYILMYELWRLGVFSIPVARLAVSLLILVTGIVGLVAGIGITRLRPWARALSLVFGGLFIFSSVVPFAAAIVASYGASDAANFTASDVIRVIITSTIYVAIPVLYSLILFTVFYKPAWQATFAKGRATGC